MARGIGCRIRISGAEFRLQDSDLSIECLWFRGLGIGSTIIIGALARVMTDFQVSEVQGFMV